MLSPGIKLVGGLAEQSDVLRVPAPVTLDLAWLARKLGRDTRYRRWRGQAGHGDDAALQAYS